MFFRLFTGGKNSIRLWCFGLTFWIYSKFRLTTLKMNLCTWTVNWNQTHLLQQEEQQSSHNLSNYHPVNSFLANNLPVSDHHWFTTIGGKSSEQEDGTSNQDEDPLLKIREHFPLQSGWNSKYDNIKCYIPFSGMNKKMLLKVKNNLQQYLTLTKWSVTF